MCTPSPERIRFVFGILVEIIAIFSTIFVLTYFFPLYFLLLSLIYIYIYIWAKLITFWTTFLYIYIYIYIYTRASSQKVIRLTQKESEKKDTFSLFFNVVINALGWTMSKHCNPDPPTSLYQQIQPAWTSSGIKKQSVSTGCFEFLIQFEGVNPGFNLQQS